MTTHPHGVVDGIDGSVIQLPRETERQLLDFIPA